MNNMYKAVGYMASVAALGSMLSGPAMAGGLEKQVASPSLSFENIKKSISGKKTTYTYDRVFKESNGVGVNLTEGELCYSTKSACEKGNVNYKIPANGEFRLDNKEFWTTFDTEELTLIYKGTDSNGNKITLKASLKHPNNN